MNDLEDLSDSALRRYLGPEQPLSMRMLALHGVGKAARRTPEREELLLRVLRADPDPVIRHDAAFALGAIMAEETQDALAAAAVADESFLVRHESLESLAFFARTPVVMEALEQGLRDEHPEVRETAEMARAYQLAKPLQVEARSLLSPSLPMHLRWAAAFQLLEDHQAGRLTGADALLSQALRSDPSAFIRHTAAFMLEEVGGTSAREQVIWSTLHDSSLLVRHEAIETLGFLPPDERTLSVIRELELDPHPIIAQTARIAREILQTREADPAGSARGGH
jgi:HEAT repeat protein